MVFCFTSSDFFPGIHHCRDSKTMTETVRKTRLIFPPIFPNKKLGVCAMKRPGFQSQMSSQILLVISVIYGVHMCLYVYLVMVYIKNDFLCVLGGFNTSL